jgi:hypothetical protein
MKRLIVAIPQMSCFYKSSKRPKTGNFKLLTYAKPLMVIGRHRDKP